MNSDLAELRKLTESLLEQEQHISLVVKRWRNILDILPIPLFITNEDGDIELVNIAMEKELNLNKKEIEGQPCHSIVGKVDKKENCACASCVNCSGFLKEVFDVGGSKYLHSKTPIIEADRIIGYICSLVNITKLIKSVENVDHYSMFDISQRIPTGSVV